MGLLTLDNFREEVKLNFADRSSFTNTRVDRWLNQAQRRIGAQAAWEELEATSTFSLASPNNSATFAVVDSAAAVGKILLLRIDQDGDEDGLDFLPMREFYEEFPRPASETADAPEIYTVWGETVYLSRPVDKTYQLASLHTKKPTTLTTGGQTSDLNDKDDMIIALTTSMLFSSLGNLEGQQVWRKMYEELLQVAVPEDRARLDLDRTAQTQRRS